GKTDPKILDEAVEAISRESENMKRIVDQLLWLAKLGNFSLNNSIFNLYETVDDIVAGYKLTNIKHDITLSGDASVTLNTDKNLITEAVRTLVDNAIKYTQPETGEIKINIARIEDGVELTIADNGIGISKDDQAHIFERFYRCDKVRGRESGSSGLGLTICKSIVEMMGGSIAVDSELGKGSTFKITLH
ncbi:MAG: HAMP domain-containing histidine kinase, partial [Clostridiales bacterium]|nr:HAMP domain-containing histidine kinase [Clostridiales bacterium]